MRLARRPRRALGLRGRIVGALLFTAAATLAVAAIALLGPLEHSLRQATVHTLNADLRRFGGRSKTAPLARLDLGVAPFARFPTDSGPPQLRALALQARRMQVRLQRLESDLESQVGGTVYVFEYPQQLIAASPTQQQAASDESFGDVTRAFATGRPVTSFATIGGIENAREAIPFSSGGLRYVLVVRKPINDITSSVRAVARAFLYAALAALGLTLVLGIPLSARLARRLRQLREAALQIAAGRLGARIPEDRTNDEVGDLSRSFATMQSRLEQQEQARRAFVSTASHELRTPLTSLEGMLELLDEDLSQDDPDLDDARELLRSARTQSRRLAQLAADLLDLSRLDAEVALRSEPVELAELSRAVLAEFQLGGRARGITTSLRDGGEAVWALGDPGSIARILRILLDNAVRVSPPGGEVTVELRAKPRPSLTVRDQGPGVDPAERELIFRRFHRGRATAGDSGFGLGLAIGRELAERMGGSLVLEPPTGEGATFTLTLPAVSAPRRRAAALA